MILPGRSNGTIVEIAYNHARKAGSMDDMAGKCSVCCGAEHSRVQIEYRLTLNEDLEVPGMGVAFAGLADFFNVSYRDLMI